MDELLQEFIAETRETLEALASEIVAWEADPADRARLDAIFRFVHTVKGSCGFLDLPRLARLSHAAEDVLAAARDGRRAPDARLVDAVLAVVDRIGELVEAIDAGLDIAGDGADGDELLIAALASEPTMTAAPSAPASAAATPATAAPRAPQRSVRLPVDLLDRMMSGMSDMVLARNELARKLRDGDADPAAEAALERLSLTVADMRDTVSRTRMQTIDALFSALPRMVRDTAATLGKQVALTIEGADVEIDRELIEAMRDPLVHIIRNAIDHGIEPPDRRIAAGKPAAGRLSVAARQSGNTIVIEVSDDGAGIDTARLVAKHAAAHDRSPAEFARMPERARLDLIFEPGLSAKEDVTQISGRGVGMDVVRANVETIGGRIELANDPGRGLAIVIHVPLTLSILPTIVLGAGGQVFAIARQSIDEIVAAHTDAVRIDAIGGGHVATVRGERMALVDLPALLGIAKVAPETRPMLAIVAIPGGSFALAVDSVIDSEELVVKPASPPVMTCGLFAGQTLPDTGVPMLVLDPGGIATACGIAFSRGPRTEAEAAPAIDPGLASLLFIDLDGVRRAVPLALVDRIEECDATAVGQVGGRTRLCDGDEIVTVVARAALPEAGRVIVVRLRAGTEQIAYAVRETQDIVALGGEWATAAPGTGLLGIALHDGAPVEIVDAAQFFQSTGAAGPRRPVCVLAGDGREWMAGFLAPALERAGYRVALDAPAGDDPVMVLAMEDDEVAVPAGGAVVRLSDRPGGASIFRYDRAAVLAAVAGALR
ncbi:MAG: chemotaxis protein CheW [Pseudomonadota bacterium]